jgi:hypothetical protein
MMQHRLEVPDFDRQREVQKRHLLDLKLNYEQQLDEKERELTKLKEKLARCYNIYPDCIETSMQEWCKGRVSKTSSLICRPKTLTFVQTSKLYRKPH